MDRDALNIIRLFGFGISVGLSIWVYTDARSLSERGAKITPVLWAILAFLVWILALPAYLLLRFTIWTKQIRSTAFLQSDRPSQKMPVSRQLVGEICLVCGQRIFSVIQGKFCPVCGNAV